MDLESQQKGQLESIVSGLAVLIATAQKADQLLIAYMLDMARKGS